MFYTQTTIEIRNLVLQNTLTLPLKDGKGLQIQLVDETNDFEMRIINHRQTHICYMKNNSKTRIEKHDPQTIRNKGILLTYTVIFVLVYKYHTVQLQSQVNVQ